MFAAAKFRWVAAFLAGLGWSSAGRTEPAAPDPRYTGTLVVQEWTPEETGGNPQSFFILQHPATGLIYAGNEDGVLEYDGARWRRLPLPAGSQPEGMALRGLEFDDHGRLWAAADNDVLIYAPGERGQWRPESLRARLPAEPELGVVWLLRQQDGFMWGTTSLGIIRIDVGNLSLKRWPVEGTPAILGKVDGEVWFRCGNRLFRAHEGEVEAVPAPPLPDKLLGLGASRTAAGVLQIEHAGGVLELRDGAWVPLSAELTQALSGNDAATRVRLRPDGGRIFSTRSRTLVFADAAGHVSGRIREPAGVNFGVTPQTLLDRDGGLWIANASGIRRAQLDRAVVRHGPAQGLRGGARKLAFDGESLLVASAQGLFVREPQQGIFVPQPGTPTDQHALLPSPAGGWLMAAGQRFGEWREGVVVSAPGAPESGLVLVADPRERERVLVCGFNTIEAFRRDPAGWHKEAVLKGVAVSLYYAASDARGVLWVASGLHDGLWRATAVDGDWAAAKLERLDAPATGLPPAPWRVAAVGDEVLVYGVRGIWHEEKPAGRLVPDERFVGLPRGAATPLQCIAAGNGTVYAAGALDFRDRIWRGVREGRGPWRFTELPLAEARGQLRLETLAESPDGRTLWLGGLDAAFSVDLAATPGAFGAPTVRWRSVKAMEGEETIYGGAAAADTVVLPRARRAVTLEFAAPALRLHLGGRTGIEYRTRAAGVDHGWTAWSPAAARELTNLPPGNVRLEVQARNHLGQEGPVAALVLQVPPFWWETWLARVLAALVGAALVAAAVGGLVRRQFARRIALLEAQAAVQQERLRIARDMHDDLGSTLAGIVHLSGVPPTEGRSAATLARIHEAARDLVQRTRDIVWAATPQHDSLESLVEQLAAHAERTLGDRGVAVQVALPATVPDEAVGSAARHDVFLAFKEAVHNAAKYAQARTVALRVELAPDALVITLADDGVGFAPGEVRGTGHGLGNMRGRLAAHGGRAEIASGPGRGTTVTLRVPRAARKS